MLERLYIKNIALITETETEFSDGLNIITGETGAGKSILIDSINLVLGERAGKELIRTGEQKAKVEADFTVGDFVLDLLREKEIDTDDNTITVSRELSVSGADMIKSVCRINGTMVSLNDLKAVMEHVVDVHGQHEHQSLLSQPRHIEYLDAFAGEKAQGLKEKIHSLYNQCKKLEKSLHTGYMSEQEREQRADILRYQVNEISALSLKEGEDYELEKEKEFLSNGERIMQALYNAKELLQDGEYGAVHSAKTACSELYPIAGLSQEYQALADTLSEAYYALESAAYAVKETADSFSFDARRLDEIEERLSAISNLKRKYGNSVEEILAFLDKAQEELDSIENAEAKREKTQKEIAKIKSEYAKLCDELTTVRQQAAENFSVLVMQNLAELGLKKAKFSVSIERRQGDMPSPDGHDEIEFLLSANAGEPEKPLRKVASGGEISRIMLSLKSVLSDCENIDTMIFDEIDTGISGTTATATGQKMHKLAEKRQILAITHLPQIAAFADTHFLVEKVQTQTGTTSHMTLLDMDARAKEVARIMGGEDSPVALKHARELIELAQKFD